MNQKLLLDTCAIIYLSTGQEIDAAAKVAINDAAWQNNVYVSPISAWELGKSLSRNELRTAKESLDFFREFLSRSQATLSALNPEVLMSSSFLPNPIHKDPMDRIIIATARINNYTVVTSDRAILDYGASGHVKVLAC